MSRGAEGTTEASGRRDQAGLAARKRRVGAVRGAVPAQNEPSKKSDRRRAKTPINRRKSRLRRRAAPIQATGLLILAPAGLSPAEQASLGWTHNRTCGFPASGSRTRSPAPAAVRKTPRSSPCSTCRAVGPASGPPPAAVRYVLKRSGETAASRSSRRSSVQGQVLTPSPCRAKVMVYARCTPRVRLCLRVCARGFAFSIRVPPHPARLRPARRPAATHPWCRVRRRCSSLPAASPVPPRGENLLVPAT